MFIYSWLVSTLLKFYLFSSVFGPQWFYSNESWILFNLLKTEVSHFCFSDFLPKTSNSFFLSWCPRTFDHHLWLSTPLGLPPSSTVTQFISQSPGDAGPWPLNRSVLSGCWQMHRYCIYNKYFITKLITPSLYQKSLINNSIVNKIKCMYWLNYKIVIGLKRKTSKC